MVSSFIVNLSRLISCALGLYGRVDAAIYGFQAAVGYWMCIGLNDWDSYEEDDDAYNNLDRMVARMISGDSVVDSWIVLVPLSLIHILICIVKEGAFATSTLCSIIDSAVLCTLIFSRGVSISHDSDPNEFSTDKYITVPLSLIYIILWFMFYVISW